METIQIDRDIKVFYVRATSYPEGIIEAHNRLHAMIPFSKDRRYFGISRPENNGKIVYRAGTEEMALDEADKYNCETLVLKKGIYYCIIVNDFRKDVLSIDSAFKTILAEPELDPQGYCVEWYANDKEAVKCMVRIKND